MAMMTEPSSKALGLFDDHLPFCLLDQSGVLWCLPVLRTEAALRLEETYLAKTAWFFDQGLAPPAGLHEAVERAALEAHGIESSDHWVEAYRVAARNLHTSLRQEIFFLRANDRLFRPKVYLPGQKLEGALLTPKLAPTSFQQVLAYPRTILMASTST